MSAPSEITRNYLINRNHTYTLIPQGITTEESIAFALSFQSPSTPNSKILYKTSSSLLFSKKPPAFTSYVGNFVSSQITMPQTPSALCKTPSPKCLREERGIVEDFMNYYFFCLLLITFLIIVQT
jgi:hypothetical protein